MNLNNWVTWTLLGEVVVAMIPVVAVMVIGTR